MKNLEKIAIDTIVDQFITKYGEMIEHTISSRAAVETAQANFKKAAGPLMQAAKDTAIVLLEDSVDDEAIKYFEDKITDSIKIPFKVKN